MSYLKQRFVNHGTKPASPFSMHSSALRTTMATSTQRSPSSQTLGSLDLVNFLLSDVQMGVGPFLVIYLAGREWKAKHIGIALAVHGMAETLTRTPVGGLVDRVPWKRALLGGAVIAVAIAALALALFPVFWSVLGAQLVIGSSSSVFFPAICAMSLGIVGRANFDARQGRNQMFNAVGNVTAAAGMGLLGYLTSNQHIFFFVAAMAIPTVWALRRVQPTDINHQLARGCDGRNSTSAGAAVSIRQLFSDRALVTFFVCAVLFYFANAALLTLVGQMQTKGSEHNASLFMAACVITTQMVAALFASWLGRTGGVGGRKPWLLLAFGVLPLRTALSAVFSTQGEFLALQLLDGIGVGVFGVVSVLVIADRTQGTGRFNLALGAFSTAVGLGAALSQFVAGSIVHDTDFRSGFVFLTAAALVALLILALFMPETHARWSNQPAMRKTIPA